MGARSVQRPLAKGGEQRQAGHGDEQNQNFIQLKQHAAVTLIAFDIFAKLRGGNEHQTVPTGFAHPSHKTFPKGRARLLDVLTG